jgi:hypothetical protein
MEYSDYIADARPIVRDRNRYIVLKTAIVVYATLALLAFTIPGNLVNWLKGLRPSAAQEMLIPYAERLERESERVGADGPYKLVRGLFLKFTGKDDD